MAKTACTGLGGSLTLTSPLNSIGFDVISWSWEIDIAQDQVRPSFGKAFVTNISGAGSVRGSFVGSLAYGATGTSPFTLAANTNSWANFIGVAKFGVEGGTSAPTAYFNGTINLANIRVNRENAKAPTISADFVNAGEDFSCTWPTT